MLKHELQRLACAKEMTLLALVLVLVLEISLDSEDDLAPPFLSGLLIASQKSEAATGVAASVTGCGP